ncbi:MAG: DUF5680 domain-containing protein [Candidatus Pacebacteria bacterium]|nr:DUF5680 domain-containing protein [Candidatus Paceibacterota bacterium]
MEIEKLEQFLKEAKRETYANKNAEKVSSTRLNSEDYEFKKGDFLYHDTYFGKYDFIGEEIVYFKDNPSWGMNYCGYVLSEEIDKEELYDFLKETLMKGYLRGQEVFEKNDWRYENTLEGDLKRFTGIETIFFNKVLVYKANYHGGLIK